MFFYSMMPLMIFVLVRCKLDIDMIENAMRLRDIMVGALNTKLTRAAVQSLTQAATTNGTATPKSTESNQNITTPPTTNGAAVPQSAVKHSMPIPPDVLPNQNGMTRTPKMENGHHAPSDVPVMLTHVNGEHAIKAEPNTQPKTQHRGRQMNG